MRASRSKSALIQPVAVASSSESYFATYCCTALSCSSMMAFCSAWNFWYSGQNFAA